LYPWGLASGFVILSQASNKKSRWWFAPSGRARSCAQL